MNCWISFYNLIIFISCLEVNFERLHDFLTVPICFHLILLVIELCKKELDELEKHYVDKLIYNENSANNESDRCM